MQNNMARTSKGLLAPKEYFEFSGGYIDEITNGCGPAGWKFDLVPDTIYGLNVAKACEIHDICYHIGETVEDKKYADKIFLENLYTIIRNRGGNKLLIWLRKRRADKYFFFVDVFGFLSFKEEKPAKIPWLTKELAYLFRVPIAFCYRKFRR